VLSAVVVGGGHGVVATCPTLTFSPAPGPDAMLNAGTVGKPYSQTITASGGSGSYYWILTGYNTDQTGLSLTKGFAGATFTVSGTPTTAGTWSFSFTTFDAPKDPTTGQPRPCDGPPQGGRFGIVINGPNVTTTTATTPAAPPKPPAKWPPQGFPFAPPKPPPCAPAPAPPTTSPPSNAWLAQWRKDADQAKARWQDAQTAEAKAKATAAAAQAAFDKTGTDEARKALIEARLAADWANSAALSAELSYRANEDAAKGLTAPKTKATPNLDKAAQDIEEAMSRENQAATELSEGHTGAFYGLMGQASIPLAGARDSIWRAVGDDETRLSCGLSFAVDVVLQYDKIAGTGVETSKALVKAEDAKRNALRLIHAAGGGR
jgi:hypothetical protein